MWLKHYKKSLYPEPDPKDAMKLKEYMRVVYEQKRFHEQTDDEDEEQEQDKPKTKKSKKSKKPPKQHSEDEEDEKKPKPEDPKKAQTPKPIVPAPEKVLNPPHLSRRKRK